MAATGRHLRRALGTASVAVLLLAGCGRGDGPGPEPSPPVGSGTPTGDLVDVGQDFPTTAQEYAEVTVAAWAGPDLIRLAELATAPARAEIVELPEPPDLSWTFIQCQDEAGTSGCSFYNVDGDFLVLTVDHGRLGGPRAAVAASFDPTSHPEDAGDYLAAFLDAWAAGNRSRMDSLATAEVVEVYTDLPRPAPGSPPDGHRQGEPAGPEITYLVPVVEGEVATVVHTAMLGGPRAIRTAALQATTSRTP